MKINLNKPVLTPSGEPIRNMFISKELANGLANSQSSNPLKVWEWCQKLATEGTLELDTEDLNLFKDTVKNAKGFNVILIGQVLQEIEKQNR